MSNSYTYIVAGASSSQAVYYTGVAASKSPKQIPLPKSTAKADATGSPQEAWSTLKAPSDNTVEGGLYSEFRPYHPLPALFCIGVFIFPFRAPKPYTQCMARR